MAAKDKDKTDETAEGEKPEGEGVDAAVKKKGPLDGILAMLPVPDKLKLPVLIAVPVLLILLIVVGLLLSGVFAPKKPKKCAAGEGTEQSSSVQTTEAKSDDKPKSDDKDKKADEPSKVEPCTPEQTEADAEAADAADKDKKGDEKPAYYNMPDILVNLDGHGRKASVLKIAVTIQVNSAEDVKLMEDKMPRVVDDFQTFLREVRVEDLRGSAGIYRLRQELLARVKPAVAPIKVKDVLFKELLIQ